MIKVCLNCSCELFGNQKKFCSVVCANKINNKVSRYKNIVSKYPKFCGLCQVCGNDIIAKNAGFDKKNRKFCSCHCKTISNNKTRVWKESTRRITGERSRKLFTGKKLTPEQCEIRRINNLGEKSHFWRGGLTDTNRKLRNSSFTKNWRNSVFERDNYTCADCKVRGKKLAAHHLINWSDDESLRFELSNGITLCWDCHYKRHKGADFWKRSSRFKKPILV